MSPPDSSKKPVGGYKDVQGDKSKSPLVGGGHKKPSIDDKKYVDYKKFKKDDDYGYGSKYNN
jgi:hypothetical protein